MSGSDAEPAPGFAVDVVFAVGVVPEEDGAGMEGGIALVL